MDRPFLCPDCGIAHDEPSEAVLGHRARCADCALTLAIEADCGLTLAIETARATVKSPAIAA